MAVKLTIDRLNQTIEAIRDLKRHQVFVGITEETTARAGEEGVTNAMLAYIHEYGAPAANIPARPFFRPGIARAQKDIVAHMKAAAKAALAGDKQGVLDKLDAAGDAARIGVRKQFMFGSFAPLKPTTIRARMARGNMSVRPLLDTEQLYDSITYAVRKKGR